MHHHRFSYLVIALLLVLATPDASFAATVVYAQTIKGVIYKSTDYGATFQAGTSPVVGKSIKTYPNQPGVVYLVGESLTTPTGTIPKGIYKSTDYGVTWALFADNSTVFGNPSGSIADLAVDPNN